MAGLYDAMIGAGASGASNGWAKVGDAIGTALGGGQGPKTYMETMSRGHEMQRKLAEAKIKTDELNARESNQAALAGLFPEGDPRAAALSNVMRMGDNFDQGTQGLGNLQDQGLKDKALAAMTGGGAGGAAPNMEIGNAILSVLQGKPVDLTKVSGGTSYNPMMTPDNAQLQTTPAETRALGIRESRASGQNAADMARATKPSAARSGSIVDQQAKWYDAQLKKAAQGALTDAKLKGYDVTGLGIADAMAMLENNGEFQTLDGHTTAKWTIKRGDIGDDPGNDVPVDDTDIKAEPGAPVTEPKDSPAVAAMSGTTAPAVPVATRIAQAKAALASGQDPAQVRQLLGSMGINPAAAGL